MDDDDALSKAFRFFRALFLMFFFCDLDNGFSSSLDVNPGGDSGSENVLVTVRVGGAESERAFFGGGGGTPRGEFGVDSSLVRIVLSLSGS